MNDDISKSPVSVPNSTNETEISKFESKISVSNEAGFANDTSKTIISADLSTETKKDLPSLNTLPTKSQKDPNMCGVITLSIGIAFIFFGFNTAQNFATPLLGNLGSYSMAIVYLVNALCNFIVPAVIDLFPNERLAMSVHGLEYGIYIATFIYFIPLLSVTWSALHGFTSSVLCAVQGIALQSYSTKKDRGKKSGIFFGIYMFGSALGNIIAFALLNVLDISNNTAQTGWLGPASWLFVVLSLSCFIGDIILFFLPKPVKIDDTQYIKRKSTIKIPLYKRIHNLWRLMTRSNIKFLLVVFLNVGYGAITVSGQITRHIHDKQYVGIFMCIYSIADVIWSNICGNISDKYGSNIIILSSVISEIIALILSYMGNFYSNYGIMYAASIFFALQDAAIQTESLNLVGHHFQKQNDEANCIFRMFQCLGGGICFIISPLFVDTENGIPSNSMFLIELIIAGIVAILSYIFFFIFNYKIKHIEIPSQTQN